MMRPSALLRLAAAATAALALAGCISLLPKTKAVSLYRFGAETSSAPADATAGTVGVFRANGSFQREAAGDRLLTSSGGKVAYLAETRWAAPAAVLWDEAVAGAFDADNGPARLIVRGERANADYVLRLDVRTFEARYEHGPKAAPTVVVRVRAALTRRSDGSLVAEKLFEARATASRNRVRTIVPAYQQAVSEILGGLVAWTNENATPA
jgi:cholesterol transport system auxiliary component